jgi:signal transduction histidine kinase
VSRRECPDLYARSPSGYESSSRIESKSSAGLASSWGFTSMDLGSSLRSSGPRQRYSYSSKLSPELSLGLARVWTAEGILLLVWLHPSSGGFPLNRAILSGSAFVLYSLVVFLLLRDYRKWPDPMRVWLHAGDVAWTVLLPLLTREPQAFLLAFLFVLAAAVQRWNPSRLLETGGAIALLVNAELLVEYKLPAGQLRDALHPSIATYISWSVFALFAGGLIWLLARREAAQRWGAAADAAQRAHSRVSMELHDTIVQSLFTIECYIERIRSKTNDLSPAASNDLTSLQDLVHKTAIKLRDIIGQERPLDLGSKSFVDYVTALVAEFEQDTGIAVHFIWDCGNVSPPPSGAGELVRIIQEALLNIRKHSGAHNVTIGFGLTRGNLRFWIDDDGQGFDFSGRLNMIELESTSQGPFVIRERVFALGGELAVESKPGRGARLEIALPKDAFG